MAMETFHITPSLPACGQPSGGRYEIYKRVDGSRERLVVAYNVCVTCADELRAHLRPYPQLVVEYGGYLAGTGCGDGVDWTTGQTFNAPAPEPATPPRWLPGCGGDATHKAWLFEGQAKIATAYTCAAHLGEAVAYYRATYRRARVTPMRRMLRVPGDYGCGDVWDYTIDPSLIRRAGRRRDG